MKKIVIIIPFLLNVFFVNAQSIDFYTSLIDTTIDEYISDICEFSNGFIAIGGVNNEINPTPNPYRFTDNGLFIKLDDNGNIVQKTTFLSKRPIVIKRVNNNSFICAGTREESKWVAAVDSNLNIIWEWYQQDTSTIDWIDKIEIIDTSIYLFGTEFHNSRANIYLGKISTNGYFIQDTVLDLSGYQYTEDLFKDRTSTSDFWIAVKGLNISGVSYVDLLKVNENLQFIDTVSMPGDAQRYSFFWDNNDYIIAGGISTDPAEIVFPPNSLTAKDLVFTRQHRDSTLLVWPSFEGIRTFTGKTDTSEVQTEHRTLDFITKEAIYLGGSSNVYRHTEPTFELFGFQNNNTWLLINCLDSTGNLQWQRYFGGDENYHLMSIRATQDGGVLLLGTSFDYTSGVNRRNVHIIKLKNDILDNTSFVDFQKKIDIQLYPNPVNDFLQFEIKTTKIQSEQFDLQVYNMNGQLLMQRKLRTGLSRFNLQNLSTGTYFYSITDEQHQLIKSGQFLKVK